MAAISFAAGDQLIWESRERGALIERRVRYEGTERGEHVVRFGLNLHTVHADELHPLPSPPAAPVIPTPLQSPPPEPIETRRAALRHAHVLHLEATAAAQRADELMLRADRAVSAARHDLETRFGQLEERAAGIALARVMNGGEPLDDIDPQTWADREATRQRLVAAETARNRLASEAAQAWQIAKQTDNQRKAAAKHVLAGLVEEFIAELVEIESEAASRRAETVALAQLYIDGAPLSLSDDAAGAVANGPMQLVDPIGLRAQCVEARQAPWVQTFERLMSDADAGLEPNSPNSPNSAIPA